MRKFIVSCGLFGALFVFLVALTHLFAIWKYDKVIEREWRLRPDQDHLFVGSSQIGCSIVEDPRYHNKVIWTSSKPIQSTLARLLEMERRGYLSNVKICFIRLNSTTIAQQNVNTLSEAWYNEFPFSWRYPDVYCCSWWKLLEYGLNHLHYPFLFGINDVRPKGRPSIAERNSSWRTNFFSVVNEEARRFGWGAKRVPNWQQKIDETVKGIQSICAKHQIRLIALDIPFLPHYVRQMPQTKLNELARWKDHLTGGGVEFIDVPGSFGEDCYFDEVHMVERGAQRYTKILYDRLKLWSD